MPFDLSASVAIVSFCMMLYAIGQDVSSVVLIPVLAAIAFPSYPINAAFSAYVVCLLWGTLFHLVSSFAGWDEKR
jgi:hypothetical protein